MLDRVVAGWVDVPALLRGRESQRALSPPASASRRGCTSTTNTRRSTRSSRSSPTTRRDCCTESAGWSREQGCDLDLALIATEGRKAIDVLHVTKAGPQARSNTNADALKQGLERVLEAPDETH